MSGWGPILGLVGDIWAVVGFRVSGFIIGNHLTPIQYVVSL